MLMFVVRVAKLERAQRSSLSLSCREMIIPSMCPPGEVCPPQSPLLHAGPAPTPTPQSAEAGQHLGDMIQRTARVIEALLGNTECGQLFVQVMILLVLGQEELLHFAAALPRGCPACLYLYPTHGAFR